MPRITIPSRNGAPAASQPYLDAIGQKFGVVPNLFRLMANSPAVIAGYSGLTEALSGALDVKTRERIALAVARVDDCEYCLAAHSYLGLTLAKLGREEIGMAQKGVAPDGKAGAAATFATAVVERRGHVATAEIDAVRAAGYGDAEIVEIVALVAENVLTNFLNNVARTEIDFPVVALTGDDA